MKRIQLKSKQVNKELEQYNLHLVKKDQVELFEDTDSRIIIINKQPSFFYHQDRAVPTLKYLQEHHLHLPSPDRYQKGD